MPDYKSMYFSLFNSIIDAIDILKDALKKGEDAYIETDADTPVLTLLHAFENSGKAPDPNKQGYRHASEDTQEQLYGHDPI